MDSSSCSETEMDRKEEDAPGKNRSDPESVPRSRRGKRHLVSECH